MRRLKHFFESSYIRNNSKTEELIKSIWFITEDEIFESFSELHDGIDVDISINFYLKGKNFKYELNKNLTIDTPQGQLNLERIEAYAASGLMPCFEIDIIKNNDKESDRKMHAYAIESLHQIEEYSLFDIKRGLGYLKLHLKLDDNSQQYKSFYHKKSARSFNSLFSEFKKYGYDVVVSRSFAKDNKLNLMYSNGSKKLYYITLEKNNKIELKMIDELSTIKLELINLINKLNKLPDIYHVDELFDIKTTDKDPMKNQILTQFTLYVYEK
jgi:hypothetical protein